MTPLEQQQQALLQALFLPLKTQLSQSPHVRDFERARGMKVYQANAHHLAEHGLRSAFPVVAQLLGDESFAQMARAFWHAHPPDRGDIGQWGHKLDQFLAASEQLAEEPYLSDVARLEWVMHVNERAADAMVVLPSFELLTQHEPNALHLHCCRTMTVLRSRWPIVSIVLAHRVGSPTLVEAGQRLRTGQGEIALAWRDGMLSKVRELQPDEATFLERLWLGNSLDEALEHAGELDLLAWLPMAVQTQLVLKAVLAGDVSGDVDGDVNGDRTAQNSS